MTKRAFGRREGEEQIPWLMHTCPRLLPRWSSKRLLRNKGLRLFLAGLDWSADFAAGTVHGMEVGIDRKSTRLNSSHGYISYAVFCLKKKKIYANVWLITLRTCMSC